jgi:hypothetical protein
MSSDRSSVDEPKKTGLTGQDSVLILLAEISSSLKDLNSTFRDHATRLATLEARKQDDETSLDDGKVEIVPTESTASMAQDDLDRSSKIEKTDTEPEDTTDQENIRRESSATEPGVADPSAESNEHGTILPAEAEKTGTELEDTTDRENVRNDSSTTEPGVADPSPKLNECETFPDAEADPNPINVTHNSWNYKEEYFLWLKGKGLLFSRDERCEFPFDIDTLSNSSSFDVAKKRIENMEKFCRDLRKEGGFFFFRESDMRGGNRVWNGTDVFLLPDSSHVVVTRSDEEQEKLSPRCVRAVEYTPAPVDVKFLCPEAANSTTPTGRIWWVCI